MLSRIKKLSTNKNKGLLCILTASLLSIILIMFDNYLTNLMMTLPVPDFLFGPKVSITDTYVRYHNAVVYSVIGAILVYVMGSIGYFLLESKRNESQLIKYSYLTITLLRWIVFFVFLDIVLQNLRGKSTSVSEYTMQYQILGAMVWVGIYILRNFFISNKGPQR